MINWRIYYANGDTWDNECGFWEDAPADGVVCVVVKDPNFGSLILNGLDYYYKITEDEIGHTRDIGPQLRRQAPWLKFGVAVPRKQWQSVLQLAINDGDFPRSQKPHRRSTDGGE